MSTVSVWAEAVIALATLLRARPECRDPEVATSDLGLRPVYIGPQWARTQDPADALVIGHGEDQDVSGSFEQEPSAMATSRPRREQGQIRCLASTQLGDLDPAIGLRRAFALLDVVDAVLRVPATGGDGDLGLKASIPVQHALFQLGSVGAVRWVEASSGLRCNVEFTVTYEARVHA